MLQRRRLASLSKWVYPWHGETIAHRLTISYRIVTNDLSQVHPGKIDRLRF